MGRVRPHRLMVIKFLFFGVFLFQSIFSFLVGWAGEIGKIDF